jgi:hypothetical protein
VQHLLKYIYFNFKVLAADWEGTGARKKMLPVERLYAYNLKVNINIVTYFNLTFMAISIAM